MALQIFGGGGGKSASLDGNGNVPAAQLGNVTDVTTALLGNTNGQPIKPWTMPPTTGAELWVANRGGGNIFNAPTSTITATANGTTQDIKYVAFLQAIQNAATRYRLSWNLTSLPANTGSFWVTISLVTADGSTPVTGTQIQYAVSNGNTPLGPWQFDFEPPNPGVGQYLNVTVRLGNNIPNGQQLILTNISLRQTMRDQQPILYTQPSGQNHGALVFTPLLDPVASKWRMIRTQLLDDGALTVGLREIDAFQTPQAAFQYPPPDPTFVAASNFTSTGSASQSGSPRSLRIQNNDQIMEVQKADLSYELRCNVHGGETLRSTSATDLKYEVEHGDGVWLTWDGTGQMMRSTRRFRCMFNTQVARSAPDSDVFANVNHLATFFGDGMMRMDRTTTFTKTVRLRSQFEWMSSHSLTAPAIGRIGTGLVVVDEIDAFPLVAVPAAPTGATSTTGGTLAAGTYRYGVTALGTGGETSLSPTVNITTTGATSTTTLTFAAPANATGIRVYGRVNADRAQSVLATLPPAATTWTDDGSAVPSGVVPPLVNRARRLDAASIATDAAQSDKAAWSAWYDPIANMVTANIFDRDATANRANVKSVSLRMESGAGVRKSYMNTQWVGDGSPDNAGGNSGYETQSVASGSVWTATHWSYTYIPADPANYHLEAAYRAANLTKLKTIYPAT